MTSEKNSRPSVKIIGIGFHKTGTSSLGYALGLLGYRCGAWGRDIAFPVDQDSLVRDAIAQLEDLDVVEDLPWPLLYRELDTHFAGAKFILTLRAPDRWIASVVRHFGAEAYPLHSHIYGVPCAKGHEARYLQVYQAHNQAVMNHFRDRPGDLLVLDLEQGEGWDKLCPFLGQPLPSVPFPHRNPAQQREAPLRRLRKSVKKKLRQFFGTQQNS